MSYTIDFKKRVERDAVEAARDLRETAERCLLLMKNRSENCPWHDASSPEELDPTDREIFNHATALARGYLELQARCEKLEAVAKNLLKEEGYGTENNESWDQLREALEQAK